MLGLFLVLDDGGSTFLRNIRDYTSQNVVHTRHTYPRENLLVFPFVSFVFFHGQTRISFYSRILSLAWYPHLHDGLARIHRHRHG
jgi:hypothetical protein